MRDTSEGQRRKYFEGLASLTPRERAPVQVDAPVSVREDVAQPDDPPPGTLGMAVDHATRSISGAILW
jgi:hypothetical protein